MGFNELLLRLTLFIFMKVSLIIIEIIQKRVKLYIASTYNIEIITKALFIPKGKPNKTTCMFVKKEICLFLWIINDIFDFRFKYGEMMDGYKAYRKS